MKLDDIKFKITDDQPLSFDEGVYLYNYHDLNQIGALANFQNRKLNGNRVYYNRNLHLNHTNICAKKCKFCSFFREKGSGDSYVVDPNSISLHLSNYKDRIDEIHIVGGLNPDLGLDYYENLISKCKEVLPKVKIKGFTAVEIDFFAKKFKLNYDQLFDKFSSFGLDSIPGGGAEVFSKRVRDILCPDKLSGDQWLKIHSEAHSYGIKSNATMLYGHIETVEEKVEHLMKLRELQDQTGGFQCFIPLAYQPHNNEVDKMRYTTGLEDLREVSVSRLILNNFNNIKVYWVMVSPSVAQIALSYGANDIDGTINEERIGNAAGSKSGRGVTEDYLIQLISDSGKEAVRRDSLYNEFR